MFRFVFFALLTVLSIERSSQLSSGAPLTACDTLVPLHQGNSAQPLPSPFAIDLSATNIFPGERIRVQIRSIQGERSFLGFMVQARTADPPISIVGRFIAPTGTPTFQFRDCSGSQTTVTHILGNRQTSMVFDWEAPAGFRGKIRFQ